MVVFVGHTLLLGGVSLDIYDVSNMVVDEEGGQFNGAVVYRLTSIDPSLDAAL